MTGKGQHASQGLGSQQGQFLKGCAFFLCALSTLAALDALAKDLVQRNPAPLVNMVRYSVVLLMAVTMMLIKRVPFRVHPAERRLLLLRGFCLGVVGICFMPALIYLPLGEATALYFVAPLIVVLLAPMVLGEHVKLRQYLAVVVGMIGMLLIVNPGGEISLIGSGLMLVAATSFAMVQLLTRKLSHRVISEQQFFYAAAVCTPMGLAVLILFWPDALPPSSEIIELGLMGFCGALGQYLLIYAFKFVPASTLAPINYFQLIVAVILSKIFFDQTPSLMSVVGMVLIVAAGLSLTMPMLMGYLRSKAKTRRNTH